MRAETIAGLLPDVIRRTHVPGGVLDAVLAVMAEQHRPVESVLEHFDLYVDPYRCPARFVPYLARWVGYDWLLPGDPTGSAALPTGDGPLRDLLAEAAELARLRGTGPGLLRTLELAVGVRGFSVEPGPAERPFTIVVRAPSAARPFADLVARIVTHDKPAFVTAEVTYADPPDPDPEAISAGGPDPEPSPAGLPYPYAGPPAARAGVPSAGARTDVPGPPVPPPSEGAVP